MLGHGRVQYSQVSEAMERSRPAEDVVEPWVELHMVFVEVFKQLLRAQHLGNADKLVVVIMAMEEWLLAEYH